MGETMMLRRLKRLCADPCPLPTVGGGCDCAVIAAEFDALQGQLDQALGLNTRAIALNEKLLSRLTQSAIGQEPG